MKRSIHSNQKGFSLVELSIVLVVIGLIVGGITAGVSIVKGSKLKSVMTDIESYKTALLNFRSQYDALPGDMLNAHAYFDDGADGVCGTDVQCNGNGNRRIQIQNNGNDSESYRAWQHLSLAGLVPGNFTGIGYGSGKQADIGVNVPASKVAGGGYSLVYSAWHSSQVKGNGIQFGSFRANNHTQKAVIAPRDAANIEKKIDDNNPEYGKVSTHSGQGISQSECLTGVLGSFAFNLQNTNIVCRMLFILEKE